MWLYVRQNSAQWQKYVCRQKCMSNLSEVWGCVDNPIILWVKSLYWEYYGNIGSDLMRLLASAERLWEKSLPRPANLPIRRLEMGLGGKGIFFLFFFFFLNKKNSQVTNTTFNTVQSTHQEQCEMLKVFYLSCLMTSHSGLLCFDSESQNGELSYISTFKGGPSRYMIGNFRHNLHIINSRIDIVAVVQVLCDTLLDQGESPSSSNTFRRASLSCAWSLNRC